MTTVRDSGIDAVQNALQRVHADADAPEVHGIQCGMLCAPDPLDVESWWRRSMPEVDPADLLAAEARDVLVRLFESTREDLNSPVLDFPLLLPGDDASIEVRVDALGQWVSGFLLGLSLGGVNDLGALPAELSEFTSDLVALTRTEDFELSGSEEDERAYAELVEFVRMGVLVFAEEMHPSKAPPVEGPLH